MISSQIQYIVSSLNKVSDGYINIGMVNGNIYTFHAGVSVKLDKDRDCIIFYENDDIRVFQLHNICDVYYHPIKEST